MIEYFQNLIMDFINRHPLMSIGFALILISAIGSLGFKRVQVRTNQRISLIMFLTGVLFIFLDLPTSSSNSKSSSSQNATTNPASNSKNSSTSDNEEMEAKQIVKSYFQYLGAHKFDRIEQILGDKVIKFLNEDNLNKSKVKRILQANWKQFASERYEIQWNTWTYAKDSEGNHSIQLDVKRVAVPITGEELNEILQVEIKIDKSLKIIYYT